MYTIRDFKALARDVTWHSMNLVKAYNFEGHRITAWGANDGYVTIYVDGEPICTRALRRNIIKLALKHINKAQPEA